MLSSEEWNSSSSYSIGRVTDAVKLKQKIIPPLSTVYIHKDTSKTVSGKGVYATVLLNINVQKISVIKTMCNMSGIQGHVEMFMSSWYIKHEVGEYTPLKLAASTQTISFSIIKCKYQLIRRRKTQLKGDLDQGTKQLTGLLKRT